MTTRLFDDVIDDVIDDVRQKLPGFCALALVGLDGRVEDIFVVESEVSSETVMEFATLLRISHRTAEDAAVGDLSEMSWKSGQMAVLVRRVTPGWFLLSFVKGERRTGYARYVLGRAAGRLQLRI